MKLLVIVRLGEHLYGLEGNRIDRVLPLLKLRPMPHFPQFVRGICNVYGAVVPVLDLCSLLMGRESRAVMSTRIMIVRYPCWDGQERTIGLVSENITEIRAIDPAQLEDTGVRSDGAPYLGPIVNDESGLIQVIEFANLLPESLQQTLFRSGAGN